MSIRFILVLISFIFLQNTPSVSGAGYVRFVNFSPDEIFVTVNSVTEPSLKSGAFTGFFSYPSGSQTITIIDTSFAKTYTGTFAITDSASKFISIVSDGGSSFLLNESPEANVTTAPVGFGSIILVNSATTDLAVSVDGAVSGPYSSGDFSSEILVNTTATTSLTNTTQRNITVELAVNGAGTKSFTLQIQSQAKYLILVGVHSNNNTIKYSLIKYAGNTVQLTHVCNQVWTATNPDPYPITFKWDWRPRQKRFEMTLGALSSKLLVVETKQNANSKKVYTYQYDSEFLTTKVVQTLFSKKCLSVSSVCRGKYKLTNLATTTLPVVYQSFSPSGLNDGNYTTLTNDTYVTLNVNTVTSVNTTAVNATYFKTGYEEVFKVWLSLEGVKSRLLATFQGAVSQGTKCP